MGIDFVLENTTSGGVCINDCLFQLANNGLPFGGVGSSGFGAYHGEAGFKEFSHLKAVMYRPTWIDPSLRYPPYTERQAEIFGSLIRHPISGGMKKAMMLASAAGILGI